MQQPLPAFPAPLAAELAGRADTVAARLEAKDPCAARTEAEALQADTIAAVNAGRVPAAYQEELGAAVSSLLGSIECPASATEPDAASGPAEEARKLSDWLRENSA